MAVHLSLILPAWNEACRLPPHLADIRRHLTARYGPAYEVLVVDDGSTDGTAEVVADAARDWPQLRLLRHPLNRGKGTAVRTGMLAAVGQRLLFADADQATPIEEEVKLTAALDAGAAVAVGTRHQARRDAQRAYAGRFFAGLAEMALGLGVSDPQCGFKLFTAEAGQRLFRQSTEPGYLFDLEVLALARRSGDAVAEVPVTWADQPGSKVRLFRDGPRMARDLLRLRRRFAGLQIHPLSRAA